MADQDQKQTETVEETVQDTAETTAAAEEAVAAEGEEATSEAAEPTLKRLSSSCRPMLRLRATVRCEPRPTRRM